jgi:hypothetical protein
LSVAVVVLLCVTTVAGAFDGERQGFILGIGVGAGLTTYTQTVSYGGNSFTSDRENEFPLMTDFKIGYAPNDLVEIYWMSKVSWFSMENVLAEDVTITNGLGGLGITYFFRPTAPSPFLTGGIGFSSWTAPFEEDAEVWYGFGLTAGVGYEFAPHWYVAGDVCWGKPATEQYGVDFSTNALSLKLTINVIGY